MTAAPMRRRPRLMGGRGLAGPGITRQRQVGKGWRRATRNASTRSDCGLFARSKQPIHRARGLREPIADPVPGYLGIRMPMSGWSPQGVLRHGPVLRMIERSDLDPDVRDAVGEKGNR